MRSLHALDAKASSRCGRNRKSWFPRQAEAESFGIWPTRNIDAIAMQPRLHETVTFRSPANGHVIDKMVVKVAVQAAMKLMRIEDHSKLWLDVQIYERAECRKWRLAKWSKPPRRQSLARHLEAPLLCLSPRRSHDSTITVRVTSTTPSTSFGRHICHVTIATKPMGDAV